MRARALLHASMGTIAMLAPPAFAQSAPASASPSAQASAQAGSDDPARLSEIVVTAQKRQESIQDTPLSITAVTGDEIQKQAQGTLDAVLRNVPGVEMQGLAQGTQIYIRGVGSSIDPSFADPSIALMVDGAYNGRTEGVESGAYDIARVEVLRGPQGTLYGRNASGGIVNVITEDPKVDGLHGYVRGQIGNYDLGRLEASVNIPVGDRIAMRVAGYREKRDGFVDDGSNDSNSWGMRGKLLVQPADWLRVVAKIDIYRARGKGMNTVPVPGSAGNLGFPPPFFFTNFNPPVAFGTNPPVCPGSPFVGCAPVARFPNGWVQAKPGDPWSNNAEHVPGLIRREAETYALDVQADLGFATLTVLPSLTRSKNRLLSNYLFGSIVPGPDAAYAGGPAFPTAGGATFSNAGYTNQQSTTRYKSVEARLTSNGDGPFKYVAGFYYLKSDPGSVQLPATGFTSGGAPYSLANTLQPGETIAGFGQLTYSLSDAFRVTGGLRISRDKSGQDYAITVGTASSGTSTYKQTQNSTQYKLGVEYDLGEQSLLYGHVSTGFKQGGISPTFPPARFRPEKLTAFEIGSKNRFWDDRVQINLAAFHYRYKDYQYSTFANLPIIDAAGQSIGSTTFIVINNAGSTKINGAEAALDFIPWPHGKITAAATYLDAKYGHAVLPNNPFVNQGLFNLDGKQIQNSPKWSANLGFEQGFEIGPGLVTLGVHSHLSTSYYTTPEQYMPGARQGGYTRTDLSARFEADAGWSITAIVRNVEKNAQTTYVFPAYRRFVTAPRTFVVTAGYNF